MISNLINIKSKKAISLLALLASFGSFISDVLEPLAPFSKYILILSIILLIIFRVIGYFKKEIYDQFSYIIIFFWLVAIMSGIVLLLKKNTNSQNGIFSNYFPIIERTQDNLGLIQKDVKEIKETTRSIKQDTKEINKKLDNIEKKINQTPEAKKIVKKIDYNLMFGNNGMIQISFMPIETAREFFISEDEKNYKSLGFSDFIDQNTGLKSASNLFKFTEYQFIKKKIFIKYLDINNNSKGPFTISLDLKNEFLKNQKNFIKKHAKWAYYDLRDQYYGVSLRGLLSYRCAIKKIKIKFDNSSINEIQFPTCDEEFSKNRKDSYHQHQSKVLKLYESIRFNRHPSKIYLSQKIEDSNFEVFYHPSNGIDYKKYLYVFHPVINKISIQVFFFDEESTIFRTFDNPKSN